MGRVGTSVPNDAHFLLADPFRASSLVARGCGLSDMCDTGMMCILMPSVLSTRAFSDLSDVHVCKITSMSSSVHHAHIICSTPLARG